MSNVVVFVPHRSTTGLRRRCPYRGEMPSFVNIGAQQWGYCEKHRVKWHLGANLTDDWLQETERDWVANQHFLDGLDLVYSVAPKQIRVGAGTSMTIDELKADASLPWNERDRSTDRR